MADFASVMGLIDAAIDNSVISDDLVLPDQTTQRGRMIRDPLELETAFGGRIQASEVVFRTAMTDRVARLRSGEFVMQGGHRYRFERRDPDRGDSLNRVDLVLQDAP